MHLWCGAYLNGSPLCGKKVCIYLGVLIVAAGYQFGSQAEMWDLDPLEGILSSSYPLLFSSLLEMTIAEDYSPLPFLLFCKQLHPWPWYPLLLLSGETAASQMCPGSCLDPCYPTGSCPETHRDFILSTPMFKIALIRWKWIRSDSRTKHIWERQRKRSRRTVLSLKRAQFLSFSENRNKSRLLRTLSRWELEYTPLRCFLIESARRLQRRGESWWLKVSSCFKGWPPLKRGLSA